MNIPHRSWIRLRYFFLNQRGLYINIDWSVNLAWALKQWKIKMIEGFGHPFPTSFWFSCQYRTSIWYIFLNQRNLNRNIDSCCEHNIEFNAKMTMTGVFGGLFPTPCWFICWLPIKNVFEVWFLTLELQLIIGSCFEYSQGLEIKSIINTNVWGVLRNVSYQLPVAESECDSEMFSWTKQTWK